MCARACVVAVLTRPGACPRSSSCVSPPVITCCRRGRTLRCLHVSAPVSDAAEAVGAATSPVLPLPARHPLCPLLSPPPTAPLLLLLLLSYRSASDLLLVLHHHPLLRVFLFFSHLLLHQHLRCLLLHRAGLGCGDRDWCAGVVDDGPDEPHLLLTPCWIQ